MKSIDTSNAYLISPIMQEEFRSLFSGLEFSGEDNRVICITSSYPNEGKSYVSYQLAKTIAEGNKRVVLIDADMRNSSLHKRLNFDKDIVGLSHVLRDRVPANTAMYTTSTKNLFIIPTGTFSSNPTTYFRSKLFKDFLVSLRSVVDYVIIDTPPIGLVTDATIIASQCDASLLVVGSGMEHIKIARDSIDTMKNANENFLGVVLNRMTADKGGYGSYGKYGRYGRYGYGKYTYGGENTNGK